MLVSDSLPNSLTDCRLVNLIDVTLACEDANSKLVEVVTVAENSDKDRVPLLVVLAIHHAVDHQATLAKYG